MFSSDQYRLLDFGAGRRLERFGALILDRPCPSAAGIRPGAPGLWTSADARFVERDSNGTFGKNGSTGKNNKNNKNDKNNKNGGAALGFRGVWEARSALGRQIFAAEEDVDPTKGQDADKLSSRPWTIRHSDAEFAFELKGSPFGHVGVFPEQSENWDRIAARCRAISTKLGRPARFLNLFGYTGGSALAAASAGSETTHLDAARNIVARAKRNAALSFPSPDDALNSTAPPVAAGPIRWIVDDAVKFVKRELKRNAKYDGIALDPPTYGHGARGEVWRTARDLPGLLRNCVELLTGDQSFVMLTCHTPGFEAPTLERLLRTAFRERFGTDVKLETTTKPLAIESEKNGALPAGDLALVALRR